MDTIPAAYIQVVKADRSPAPVDAPLRNESDAAVREAMRLNTELARTLLEQFPGMMSAAAELLRAADGAGLPARKPRFIEVDDLEDDTDDDDEQAPHAAPAFDLAALIPQIAPVIMALFGKGGIDLRAILDWRKAVPAGTRALGASSEPAATKDVGATTAAGASTTAADPTAPAEALPPIDAATMAHFIAIQSALAPAEAALAREVAGELAPAELRAWFHELTSLSVADAVTKIQALIGGTAPRKGGAA